MRYADLVGAKVARRYLLQARLGEGPLGVSFAATDRDGREVVVKLFDRSAISDEDTSRYIQTAATLKGVADRIAGIVDVAHDLDRGLLVVVREPMHGLDLASVIVVAAPMDPRGALLLVAEAAAAVAAAHAVGVLLLALKPTNVFLDPDPPDGVRIRLCDPSLRPYRVHGSFAAPELSLAEGRPDVRSDVYSLGALLYVTLSGATLHADHGLHAPLSEVAPWLAAETARLVDLAMAPKPKDRFARASELADALRAAAGPDPVLRATQLVRVSLATQATRPPPSRGDPPGARPPERADPLVGHNLAGHYTIVRALGHGGMGSVYEVTSPDGEARAAKIVARSEEGQTQLIARFLREAQSATKIVDPHVVRTLELGTDMTLAAPYMIMELLHGRDLADLLCENRPLDPLVAVRIFVQAARGLAAAHRAGVIHRDIKPANVFLSTQADGVVLVKICDFGLAKTMTLPGDAQPARPDLTKGYAILGTPAYMSPEQAMGARDLDARTDLFSLCVCLYEALGGERLWGPTSAKATELMHRIGTRPFRPLDQVAPHLPAGLLGIVRRGLERDRNARWPDADALAQALSEMSEGSEEVHVDELRLRPRDAAARHDAAVPSTTALAALPMDHSTQAVEQSIARPADRAPLEPSPPPRVAGRGRRRRMRAATISAAALAALACVGYALRGDHGAQRGSPPATPESERATPRCTTNAQCAREQNRPAICGLKRVCVALQSEDCQLLHAPSGVAPEDSTVWLGMMFPQSGDGFDSLWGPAARTVELAVRDFNDILGGIRNPRPDRPARPLGLIACDDSNDERAARAARHLVEEVGVPAVVGFRSSKEVIALATSEFLPHGVLAVATFNKSALISTIPHPEGSPRLVWRLAASNAQDAAPLSALIADVLEPRLRAGTLGPRAPLRVTVVRPESATGIGFEEGLLARLRFNGKSLAENAESFQEIVFDEASQDPVTTFVDKLITFRPHVVVYPGDSITAKLPEAVEQRWRGPSPPFYVFGTPLQDVALERLVETRPDLSPRIVGISVPAAVVPNVKLAAHFDQVFGADQTATNTTPNAYDAVYLLAYAAIASGDDVVTGAGLVRGIDRLLPPGEPLEVGPARILDAYGQLRSGGHFDLVGASGPLDFDRTTGDARFDYVFECLAVTDGQTRRVETGLHFEQRSQRLSGSLVCR